MMRHHPLIATVLCLVACSSSPTGPAEPQEPTGTMLVTGAAGPLALFDAASGTHALVPAFTGAAERFLEGTASAVGGWRDGDDVSLIHRVDLATGTVSILKTLESTVSAIGFAVHPDGDQLTFVASNWYGDGDGSLHNLDLNTGAITTLWDSSFVGLGDPHWSPDGQRLLAMAYDGASSVVLQFDFRGATPVVDTLEATRSLCGGGFSISPNGRELVFPKASLGGVCAEFVMMRLSLNSPGTATPLGFNGLAPVHSPDGNWLAYRTLDEHQLLMYRFADGEVREVPDIGPHQAELALGWR